MAHLNQYKINNILYMNNNNNDNHIAGAITLDAPPQVINTNNVNNNETKTNIYVYPLIAANSVPSKSNNNNNAANIVNQEEDILNINRNNHNNYNIVDTNDILPKLE